MLQLVVDQEMQDINILYRKLKFFISGKRIIYQNDGTILDLSSGETGGTGSINLPKTNAYANEIHYFTECILTGSSPERIKPAELETVIGILNRIQ